jgi:hypothetical protein
MLLKEHRFTFFASGEVHLLRIEELVQGLALWPSRFRIKLPASHCCQAKTIYGTSCDEAAKNAVEFLTNETNLVENSEAWWSPRLSNSPPQTVQIQKVDHYAQSVKGTPGAPSATRLPSNASPHTA